jgi:hypothetical protein
MVLPNFELLNLYILIYKAASNFANLAVLLIMRAACVFVESRRDIPYGIINLQKFAYFYVLSAHYIALSRAI